MQSPAGRSAVRYRPDIDGLRAIAVIVVIFYHAQLPGFAGGFLGVDIFFVISGYLITGIIAREISEGRFTIRHFYERRVRRILPAMLVMLTAASAAALALMLPGSLRTYGQSVVATLAFANNVLLFLTSGYFDVVNEFKPRMHSWSLGVEEQYYLLIPLLMLFAARRGGRRAMLVATAALSLASLLYASWAMRNWPVANFLLIFSRLWELGLGGIVRLAGIGEREADPASGRWAMLGLVLVVGSCLAFDEELSSPGPHTVLPVLGTCMVLAYGQRGGAAFRLLSARPMVAVGLISYSAYLFHQPLFAFTRLLSERQPSPFMLAALLPLILALAYVNWRFVEQPFRDAHKVSVAMLWLILAPWAALLFALGLSMYLSEGRIGRLSAVANRDPGVFPDRAIAYSFRPEAYLDKRSPFKPGTPVLLVFGNSFARDFINVVEARFGVGTFDVRYRRGGCGGGEDAALSERIANRAELIVLASGQSAASHGCTVRQVQWLRQRSATPIVILGTKGFAFSNEAFDEDFARGDKVRVPLTPAVGEAIAFSRRARWPAPYVDIVAKIEDRRGQVPVFTPQGLFISHDGRHLTEAGARWLAPILLADPAFAPLHRAAAARR